MGKPEGMSARKEAHRLTQAKTGRNTGHRGRQETMISRITSDRRISQAFNLLLKYAEQFEPDRIVTKTLGELEDNIHPPNFRAFEKTLYLLTRYGSIMVTAPSSIVEKPTSILHGKRWVAIRQRLSERKPTPPSAGEILLHYLYTTRSDHLRQRRREELRDILKFHMFPSKLLKVKRVLQIRPDQAEGHR